MKRLLCGVTLMLTILCLYGQPKIDSLKRIWYDETKPDTIRLGALDQLYGKYYIYTQPDSALYWANKAYVLAKEKGIESFMGSSLHVKGAIAKNAGELEKAITLLEESLSIRERLNNKLGILATTTSIANVYARRNDYANAINYDLRCLKIAEELNNAIFLVGLLNNIGTTHIELKDYESALGYFNRALEIHNLGDEGVAKYEGITIANIGYVFARQKKYQKALEYYQKALEVNEKNKRRDGAANSHFGMGEIYFEQKAIEKAKYHFTKSITLNRGINDTKNISNCLIYFGRIYQNTKPDSSFLLTTQALEMAQDADAIHEISEAAEVLSQLYEGKGQYQQALVMHKLFKNMRDSVESETNRNAVLRAEYQYEYDKKILLDEVRQEQEEREQQLRIQRERFLLFGSTALFLLLAGFYVKSRYERSLADRSKLLREIELLKERLATQTLTTAPEQKELSLDKIKLEEGLQTKIGESSWMILNLIFQNPSISNKQIAESVNLSLEGVSSSLRRMYASFGITAPSNKKIALVMKAVRMSLER